jgi:hypothetical protein
MPPNGSTGLNMLGYSCLVKKHKITTNSTTTEAREILSKYLEFSNMLVAHC